MNDQLFFAQLLGFLSFLLGVCTFFQKDDKKLKIMMVVFNLNHLVHYLLLGSIVSALSALLSAFRTVTAIYVSSLVVALLFIVIGLSSAIYFADSIWDLWPMLGMSIGTYAVFVLKGIKMRIAFLIGAVCWLINNILVGSIGGTLLEATLITVNLSTIIRLVRDNRQMAKVEESVIGH
ncbi:YgjV family protein [Psychromonas sp. GE-S-Ul-11]|uniref:YgjV family protein n=1 Tax=unclassified Psychromonas TaxID=2614957 RepID=UPI00390C94AF